MHTFSIISHVPKAAVGCLVLAALACAGCSGQAESAAGAGAVAVGKTQAQTQSQTQAGAKATQQHCLALAMYWEAKAEGDQGMLAVGQVVLNRAAHKQFPNTLCGVIQEGGEKPPCQFSWWCDGRSDVPTEQQNWQQAKSLAQQLLRKRPADRTKGALFFHAKRLKNPWHKTRTKTVTIGGHVFYK